MNTKVLEKVIEETKSNKPVALVTVISESGVSPARVGKNMVVKEDETTFGTVGGGEVEFEITKEAIRQLRSSESTKYTYHGKNAVVEVFIQIFSAREKILIIGAGHVAVEIYKLACLQKFYTVVFDERMECANRENFEFAGEIILGDVEENLKRYKIDNKCFIVICGPTHAQDQKALKAVLGRGARYIGMLGSRKKIRHIREELLKEGIDEKTLESIYAPIGIATGGDSLPEIAFSVFGEILAVKNNCLINHMKDIKK